MQDDVEISWGFVEQKESCVAGSHSLWRCGVFNSNAGKLTERDRVTWGIGVVRMYMCVCACVGVVGLHCERGCEKFSWNREE